MYSPSYPLADMKIKTQFVFMSSSDQPIDLNYSLPNLIIQSIKRTSEQKFELQCQLKKNKQKRSEIHARLTSHIQPQTEKQKKLKWMLSPLFNISRKDANLFRYINTHHSLLQCPICHSLYGNDDSRVQFWQQSGSCHSATTYIISHNVNQNIRR